MKKTILTTMLASFFVTSASHAAIAKIDNLDVRGTGIFGQGDNAVLNSSQVTAGQDLFWNITYSNMDLDGDGTANDTFTFQLDATSSSAALRGWGQGVDTGYGSLNDVNFSVSGVTGTTTDSGDTIVFDGFTRGIIAGGDGAGNIDRSADVNGTNLTLSGNNGGAWQFVQNGYANTFAPVQVLTYTNGAGTSGSLVARAHQLQFSTVAVPEPSSFAVLAGAFALGAVMIRRRRS